MFLIRMKYSLLEGVVSCFLVLTDILQPPRFAEYISAKIYSRVHGYGVKFQKVYIP